VFSILGMTCKKRMHGAVMHGAVLFSPAALKITLTLTDKWTQDTLLIIISSIATAWRGTEYEIVLCASVCLSSFFVFASPS